uniref:Uncharacterized protein n=1 Tax=Panagrolaimus superbus TaxID=310955 RepID=A0A914ZEI6_9BILA
MDEQSEYLKQTQSQLKTLNESVSKLSGELDLMGAIQVLDGQLSEWTAEARLDIELLIAHGKITTYDPAALPSHETLGHEVVLQKCLPSSGIVLFEQIKTFTKKEHIMPMVNILHVGKYSGDRTSFARINFNRSCAVINGLLVPMLKSHCTPPKTDNFFNKVHICPKVALIHDGCSPDSILSCTVTTEQVTRDHLAIETIKDEYVIATLLKTYTVVNSITGTTQTNQVPENGTFVLKLVSNYYASFNGHQIFGLATGNVSNYVPISSNIIVEAAAEMISAKSSRPFSIVDINRDHVYSTVIGICCSGKGGEHRLEPGVRYISGREDEAKKIFFGK